LFCFFTATPPPAIYTLSLHDALPISQIGRARLEVRQVLLQAVALVAVLRLLVGELHRLGLLRFQLGRRPRALARRVLEPAADLRSEEHTSELQSQSNLVCRLLLEKKK